MRQGEKRPGLDAKGHPFLFLTVAQNLCQIGQFRVPLGRQQVPLRVSPYVSGEIQQAKVSGAKHLPREGSLGFQTHPVFSWVTPCSGLCSLPPCIPVSPCLAIRLFLDQIPASTSLSAGDKYS